MYGQEESRTILKRLSGNYLDPQKTVIDKLDDETQKQFYQNVEHNLKSQEYNPYEVALESLENTERDLFGYINYQTRNAIKQSYYRNGKEATREYYARRIENEEFKTFVDVNELDRLLDIIQAEDDINFYSIK